MDAATRAFHEADAAWTKELAKVFGASRGSAMRYNVAGKGMPGSTLSAVYKARQAAYKAWCETRGIEAGTDD